MGPLLVDPRSPPRSLSLMLFLIVATRSSTVEEWSSHSSRPRAFLLEPPLSRMSLSKPPRRCWQRQRSLAKLFCCPQTLSSLTTDAIPDGWMGLDNGPDATAEQKEFLSDCKTVIMNGPMGVFEMKAFEKGTFGIVDILADLTKEKGAITIIGGGDSVAATELSGRAKDMSHISTGGGASLELLEGKVLPGVAALNDK